MPLRDALWKVLRWLCSLDWWRGWGMDMPCFQITRELLYFTSTPHRKPSQGLSSNFYRLLCSSHSQQSWAKGPQNDGATSPLLGPHTQNSPF